MSKKFISVQVSSGAEKQQIIGMLMEQETELYRQHCVRCGHPSYMMDIEGFSPRLFNGCNHIEDFTEEGRDAPEGCWGFHWKED